MSGAFRTESGGRIDRSRPLSFRFNGRRLDGFAGDTLASALIANGNHLVARSFKYHRPRGIVTAGAEEPNALVQLGSGPTDEPNVRATMQPLFDGLEARSINCWPSVGWDAGAINDRIARLIPAGFYYKTFLGSPRLWMFYEKAIRRAAGLGTAPVEPDRDRYAKRHAHADLLIVGAGPAGLAAALAAGRSGARVILADEQSEPGGTLLCETATIDERPAADWLAAALDRLGSMPNVRLLPRTTVFGYYDHNLLLALERVDEQPDAVDADLPRQRLWKIRAKEVVVATGALERPLVFADNDRPGIMLAHAARDYALRYGALAGKRAVLFANNDSAYRDTIDLIDSGIAVAAAIDARPTVDGRWPQRLRERGVEILAGHGIVATEGRQRVAGIVAAGLDTDGSARAGDGRAIGCDLVLMSGGWSPAVHLYSQSRSKLRFDEQIAAFVPADPAQMVVAAGAANGTFDLARCLAEGFRVGSETAAATGATGSSGRPPRAETATAEAAMLPVWQIPARRAPDAPGKRFVDFQNDVTAEDIALADREGYRSVEHVKRYTTAGMGTDQGKMGNINALAILAEAQGKTIPEVGTTTFRPPYTPVTIAAFAGYERGALFDPVRRTPIHAWHEAHGAVFENVGQWRRAWYYPRPGETMQEAVNREVAAARTSVGIFDASTLGKIEIIGPDAAEFLDRVYTSKFSTLKVGRIRYGIMLGENGMVIDDGVSARLAPDRFLMSTTSGHAGSVLAWIEEWLQCEWIDLRVRCVGVTEQSATVALTGPDSRRLLAGLTDDLSLDAASFPFMSWKAGRVAGIPARIMRVSFTGDASFEISVPASWGQALWQACMAVGEKYGIVPYGTEAIHVLRAEKGYFIVGRETDGTITASDLGAGWMVDMSKPDFIGKRSLLRSDTARDDRRQLVGLESENPSEVIPEGAQIVGELRGKPPMPMIGYVTSSYWSPNLDRSIALAMLKDGRRRMGDTVSLQLENRTIKAKVVSPVFFDPDGGRLRG